MPAASSVCERARNGFLNVDFIGLPQSLLLGGQVLTSASSATRKGMTGAIPESLWLNTAIGDLDLKITLVSLLTGQA